LKIPDDITLIWTDYNGGTIKQLPNDEEQKRAGGNGIYYHFQYRGGSTYEWLDTQPLARTWQQMHMAFEHNVNSLWIVNVGDIKPHEYNMEYFMRFAWDIKPWTNQNSRQFLLQWIERDFGKQYAVPIADILEKHMELGYALRPEQLTEVDEASIFNMNAYNDELQRRIDDYDELMRQTDDVYAQLPTELKDAFFEMVVYNVKCAGLHNKKVLYAYKSKAYGKEKRASAADYADLAQKAARDIDALMEHYNTGLLTDKDKWNFFACYPEKADPESPYHKIWEIPETSSYNGVGDAELKIAMEGNSDTLANLSVYDKNKRFIDLYNTGKGTVKWKAGFEDWIKLSETAGTFTKEKRIWVTVDWDKAPEGENLSTVINFKGTGKSYNIPISVFNPSLPKPNDIKGFAESHGYVSMEAEHYSRKFDKGVAGWNIINGLGRTGNSVTVLPTTIPSQTNIDSIQQNSPVLEYDVYLFNTGSISVDIYSIPAFPINEEYGLRIAVAFDNEEPLIFEAKNDSKFAMSKINRMMFHGNLQTVYRGQHTLKVWMVDPGIVLDKILLKTGGEVEQSYLGPPESYRN
jgi:hypothetical protein